MEYKNKNSCKSEKNKCVLKINKQAQVHNNLRSKIVCLGNTSIYRSQQGVISDSPITPSERVGDRHRKLLRIGVCATHCPKSPFSI